MKSEVSKVKEKITFDKFIRRATILLIVAGIIVLMNYLSSVLLPFFIGWFLAFMLFPLVKFIQFKLHFKKRFLSTITAIFFVAAVITLVIYLISEPMYAQFIKLKDLIVQYVSTNGQLQEIPQDIQVWLQENMTADKIGIFLQENDWAAIAKQVVPSFFDFISRSLHIAIGVVGSCITILYMFFILNDYEKLSSQVLRIFPASKRPLWETLLNDVGKAMNSYFRGQALVSLCMAILFAIGFTIIDFPMAIGLALLIGIMNMVPYLHTLALIPTIFLALLKAVDTQQNFWIILAGALAVFIIVQIICDTFVTPKIMGKAMNLNPAIIFLSLSVWSVLLGFIGLIIALPLTALIIEYYKQYVIKESEE